MNWKKALLVMVLLGFTFVLLITAAIGIAAVSAVATVVDSGIVGPVVEAIDEVSAGADRLHIQLDESSITFTNPDNGRSRVIVPDVRVRGESLEWRGPEVTIVDSERGEARVVVPKLPRVPRIDINGQDHHLYWSANPLAPIGSFFRGVGTMMALVLVAAGVYLLLRNRRQPSTKEKGDLV